MAFKKGQSGNPKGKPKGALNTATKIYHESIRELKTHGPEVAKKLIYHIYRDEEWALQLYYKILQKCTDKADATVSYVPPTTSEELDAITECMDVREAKDYFTALAISKTLVRQEDKGASILSLLTDEQKLQLMAWITEGKQNA